MFAIGTLDVIGTLGFLLLGRRRLARAGRELRELTSEVRAALGEAELVLPVEVRALVDGAGRPLRSWHRVPSALPLARRLAEPEDRPEIDPTAPESLA